MTQEKIEELKVRNNTIIELVMKQIQNVCPNSIDLIGIGGSFCNGDIYEKSDLDLVLISKDNSAKAIDKCFILDDVGFDIYTHDWTSFDTSSLYLNPYVTKLIDLDVIFTSEEARKYYKSLQNKLMINMQDDDLINKNIQAHFGNVLLDMSKLNNTSDIGTSYRILARIIKEVEFIIYMINKAYVKRGIKRIPEEIASMKVLPSDFLDVYNNITNCSNIEDIKENVTLLVNSLKSLLDEKNISYSISTKEDVITTKKDISANDLKGTYEEIYSNWKNKMIHAFKTNNRYLSFVTMASCQEFYDEMADNFNIPRIELISKYNPNDLEINVNSFNEAMNELKALYDEFNVSINYYANIDELENLYSNKECRK